MAFLRGSLQSASIGAGVTVGKRDKLITITRGVSVVSDDYGGETSTPNTYAQAWAEMLNGTGQERREAAQERSAKTATFICDWNPSLDGVVATDVLTYRGNWDITDVSIVGQNSEVHLTATRAA